MYETHGDAARSRHKPYSHKQNIHQEHFDEEEMSSLREMKAENHKLKKLLKQAQAKRTQITKECSHLSKIIEKTEEENQQLKGLVREGGQKYEGEKYRWEELKFLNKQLNSQIEELRNQNQSVTQKLRYNTDVLERKYEELQSKTYKRMEQCVKRVKKAIHYLESLSVKNLEKTREDLIENLRRSIQLLRGKYYEEMNCEGEIEELMNPLKAMQEQIQQKTKESSHYKSQNLHLHQQLQKYKAMQKEQIPIFKEAIEKLKKNLSQVRSQLSENEYEKIQLKKKYEEKAKEMQYKYNEIFKECRKIKLQKKIYENKLEEMQADVEQQKERLMGENQMLKKLYQKNDDYGSSSRVSQASSHYKLSGFREKKTQEKKMLKKNYSSNELKTSNAQAKTPFYDYQPPSVEVSNYNEESSMLSQQNLKDEICRIDQEIIEIQQNLNKELEAYR